MTKRIDKDEIASSRIVLLATTLLEILTIAIVMIVPVPAAADDELSHDRQVQIVEDYLRVTGQSLSSTGKSQNDGADRHENGKCGTPAVLDFVLNRDKLDPEIIKSLGVQVVPRPTATTDSLDSPSGKFRIHYTTTGVHAVRNDIAGYVAAVANIFDDVYAYMVDTLGYPPPPTDEFYPSGGDEKFDVYMLNLGGSVYGLTYLDSALIDGVGSLRATAFMQIDNDYREIDLYRDRPLDAVRVTAAHEFFHVVQFGIDFSEAQTTGGSFASYWMELSAVWMEEEQYDNINDYYNYLPYFFDDPGASLQQFIGTADLHPYGSGIFGVFLSEKYGRDVIRNIWLKCAEIGYGPSFLVAANFVIDSASTERAVFVCTDSTFNDPDYICTDSVLVGVEDWKTTFSEFTMWNHFTGNRASLAPSDVGYTERFNYLPQFPDNEIAVIDNYEDSIFVFISDNLYDPDHNGAFFMRFDELRSIKYDTLYPGTDSTAIDSVLSLILVFDNAGYVFPEEWGVSVIYRFEEFLDSVEVNRVLLPPASVSQLVFPNPRQYRSITLGITPASITASRYVQGIDYNVGYLVPSEKTTIDSSLINVPFSIIPYPNPAVLNQMTESKITLRLQVRTDALTFPQTTQPFYVVDIFSLAGEFLCTLENYRIIDDRKGIFEIDWYLENGAQAEIASGVYIAYARAYDSAAKGAKLGETQAKIAVIR